MTTQVGLSFGLEPEAPPLLRVNLPAPATALLVGLPYTFDGTANFAEGSSVSITVNGQPFGSGTITAGAFSVSGTPTPAMAGDDVAVVATVDGFTDTISVDVIATTATWIRDVGITTSGGAVSQWDDNTASYDIANGTPAEQPNDQIDYVEYDGGDYLQNATLGNDLGDGVTDLYLAFAIKADVDTGGDGIFEFGAFTGTNGDLLVDFNASQLRLYANGGYKSPFVAWPDVLDTHILEVRITGGVAELWVDGVLGGSPATGGVLDLSGLLFTLGSRAAAANGFDGRFYAALVKQGGATATERAAIYGALADFLA